MKFTFYTCYKCRASDAEWNGSIICTQCKIKIHEKCIDTLDVVNFRISFMKEQHLKCSKQVDIA